MGWILLSLFVFGAIIVAFHLTGPKPAMPSTEKLEEGGRTAEVTWASKPLLTQAELKFFRVLQQAAPEGFIIWAKLALRDMLELRPYSQSMFNRISQKHVDFVITNMLGRVCWVIELDDRSHNTTRGQARDSLVDSVLESASIPCIRVRAAASYDVDHLRAQFLPKLLMESGAEAERDPSRAHSLAS